MGGTPFGPHSQISGYSARPASATARCSCSGRARPSCADNDPVDNPGNIYWKSTKFPDKPRNRIYCADNCATQLRPNPSGRARPSCADGLYNNDNTHKQNNTHNNSTTKHDNDDDDHHDTYCYYYY